MCFVALSHPIWVLRNGRAGKGLQRDRRWPEHGMLKSPVSKGESGCAGQPRTLHLWPHLWLGWHICVANTALFCAVSASGLGLAVSSELCPVLSPCVALAQGTGAGTVLWDELRCRWTPKGASTTHSHGLSSSHHATEVHFQISAQAEPPRCKAQVFQQASKLLLARIPWGWTHLSRAPVGSLPCVPCAVSGPSNSPENVVKKGLGEAALRAWDRPLAQERRGEGSDALGRSVSKIHCSMNPWQKRGRVWASAPGGFAQPSWPQDAPLEFLRDFHTMCLCTSHGEAVLGERPGQAEAEQIQCPSLGWAGSLGSWSCWNARAFGVFVLWSVIFSADSLWTLFLRSYLLSPQLPTFPLPHSTPFFP